ncbi:MAG: Zn-ribbon domain-containing OB-fold protein [Bacteroidetes bacterium]|nr:Zn-ribbon domain-containing OB-fold protein [Bacteroidota bacterium]MBU1423800.1 Zn-ribbon domain-containing OB-fold protein [Bacteroidota bacterium]MBU2470929.1 Zn-ribbon domain-containing OB-fold protein [Bacteroidota bacterium]MBU2637118.1 Zn-ribbon domain-containing OB-fold protein [Bacteroidota bacterium]
MITARYHREVPQRFRLEANKCVSCGHINFPPRLVCPKCKGQKFDNVVLKDEGKLLTYTILRVAADRFSKETPIAVGIVELEDGVKITTQIADVDVDTLQIGQKVKLVLRKIQEDGKAGILCYGYKAVVI